MQNKGALKLLAIVFAIACAYQLSFTFVTKRVESKAAEYAAGNANMEAKYLDSMRSEVVYNLGFIEYTYKECQDKEINLGLDLKGGMNVTLEISVVDVVKALANDSKDPNFTQALSDAVNKQKNSTADADFISLFVESYKKISGDAPLAQIFNTPELKDLVSSTSSNDEVVKVLRKQAESAIENSFKVLRNRIDRFGVTQPNIQRLENSDRILVELPGVKDPERVRKLLQGTASLEFWSTYNNQEVYPFLVQANDVIKELETAKNIETTPTEEVIVDETIVVDSTSDESIIDQLEVTPESANQVDMAKQFPLFSKLTPLMSAQGQIAPGAVVGRALASDTSIINTYFSYPQVKALLPRDLKLYWGIKAMDEKNNVFALYAIKANTRDGKAPLDGGSIVNAQENYAERGSSAEVSMTMNASGARTWARLTADNAKAAPSGGNVAIVLDGYVYSAPTVKEEITGGRSSISGDFTIVEAQDLANVLESGKLPAPARIIQDIVVGPSLGQESIDAGMMSFIIAFVLVLLYMWFFYSTAGIVANIALVSNVFFLFGVLVSFGAVLTLPGIAGIVLTMGMAVDANVIIYERIKEELRAGKTVSLAIADGYKNAYSAIVDGQVTTLITGIVLFSFGTGPVQGFATTLIIGILTSMFSAVFITRMIFVTLLDKGTKIKFSNKYTENFLGKTNIDFVGLRKYTYIISGALILISIASFAYQGLNYGVEFTGGRSYIVGFDAPVTATNVRSALDDAFETGGANESFEVKQFGSDQQMRIVTQYKYNDDTEGVSSQIEGMIYEALIPLYITKISEQEFVTTDKSLFGIISSEKVGASVANDIKIASMIATLFSLIAIGLYIFIRFKKWQWGIGGVVSVAHDALLTIGVFSIFYQVLPFSLEVNQAFIAAILTIIGYSINDTVIIFDRIRENHELFPKRSLKVNINHAINSTLARTVNTAGSTFVTLLAIFLFGGDVIRGFVFALMFGVVVGTFSSIFVATPVAYALMNKKDRGEE